MAEQLTYVVLAVHSRQPYDTREYLKECIRTLEENTTNYKLIFVDDFCDAEGSETIREIASRHSSSYIIRTEKQRWFTRAYNLGLRLVRTSPAVILNVDTVLGAGWLEELYAVKAEAEQVVGRVGLVSSELSGEEGRRWQHITSPTTPGNPGYCTGHCWLVDMQALYEISAERGMPGWYLDETRQENIHIRSDNDACYAMHRLGWATVRSFKSAVGHIGGRSWGHDLGRICGLTLQQVND
jgi:glycosyltransferase involved in cell wall biosynthesis